MLHDGVAGYHVVTALRIPGRRERVLVNRGWVPAGGDRRVLPDVEVGGELRVVVGKARAAAATGLAARRRGRRTALRPRTRSCSSTRRRTGSCGAARRAGPRLPATARCRHAGWIRSRVARARCRARAASRVCGPVVGAGDRRRGRGGRDDLQDIEAQAVKHKSFAPWLVALVCFGPFAVALFIYYGPLGPPMAAAASRQPRAAARLPCRCRRTGAAPSPAARAGGRGASPVAIDLCKNQPVRSSNARSTSAGYCRCNWLSDATEIACDGSCGMSVTFRSSTTRSLPRTHWTTRRAAAWSPRSAPNA